LFVAVAPLSHVVQVVGAGDCRDDTVERGVRAEHEGVNVRYVFFINVNYVYGGAKPAWIVALSRIIVPSLMITVPLLIPFSAIAYTF
jgi:hypothetical protein